MFPKGLWSFQRPGSEEKLYAALADKPDGSWNSVAEQMMLTFAESGHPVLRGTSAVVGGPFKSKRDGRTSMNYNADPTTAELLQRIIGSVDQFSIHGAIADWCQDLAQRIAAHFPQSTRTPVAKVENDPASQVPSEDVSSQPKGPLEPEETWCDNTTRNSEIFQKIYLPLTKACDDPGFMRNVSEGPFFMTIPDVHLEGYGPTSSCREYTYPRNDDRSQPKGFFRSNTKIGLELEGFVTKYFDRSGIESKIGSMQDDGTQSWMVVSRGVDKCLSIITKRLQAREKTKDRTAYSVFIFVTSLTDQTTKLEGKNHPFQRLMTTIATKSRKMTRILRHSDGLRETDGAIEWKKLLSIFYREDPELKNRQRKYG